MNHTKSTKESEIVRSWHLVDAKGKVLGRVAVEIAHKLMGKGKPNFVSNLDCGDHVVVIHANEYVVTGKKETDKLYGNYSGYPGGLKQKPLRLVRKEVPLEPIRKAVFGMLPKNKLRHRMITRLHMSLTDDHPDKSKCVS